MEKIDQKGILPELTEEEKVSARRYEEETYSPSERLTREDLKRYLEWKAQQGE